MKLKRWAALAVCFLVLTLGRAAAEDLLYTKKSGNEVSSFSVRIEKTASGYALTAGTVRDGRFFLEVSMKTDACLATLEWAYADPKTKLALKAVRDGNRIELSGTQDGRPIKKTFTIDGKPWLQFFPFGLEEFAVSRTTTIEFWAVSPSLLNCGLMRASKKSVETVMSLGREQTAVKTRVTLAGPLSVFWSADFWLSVEDGHYLKFEGTEGPGTPETTIALAQRRA
ncbi:MAG: hypothetical protein JXD23_09405 [Spirochaetales bacterium]|nr:hypothetical protein [Spirochaetales bacterium]